MKCCIVVNKSRGLPSESEGWSFSEGLGQPHLQLQNITFEFYSPPYIVYVASASDGPQYTK